MIFSLVAMTGLEKCCITSAYLQWLCHSGEFLDKSFYSFHPSGLKQGEQLGYEILQHILFQGYITANFDRVIAL